MKEEDFINWLDGFIELSGGSLTESQKELILKKIKKIDGWDSFILGSQILPAKKHIYITISETPFWPQKEFCSYNVKENDLSEIERFVGGDFSDTRVNLVVESSLKQDKSKSVSSSMSVNSNGDGMSGVPDGLGYGIHNVGNSHLIC